MANRCIHRRSSLSLSNCPDRESAGLLMNWRTEISRLLKRAGREGHLLKCRETVVSFYKYSEFNGKVYGPCPE